MKVITNYKNNFIQYFPILFFNDNGNNILMFGLGNKNISLVFNINVIKKMIFKISCKAIYFNDMKLYWFIRNRMKFIYKICHNIYGWSLN